MKISENEDLDVRDRITEKEIDQLIRYANNDPAIIKYTSDQKRFKNRESFEQWIEKGKLIYVLENASGDLLGLIWFGREELPERKFTETFPVADFGFTFAIRTYQGARGRHLSESFMKEAFKLFENSETYKDSSRKGVWLETSADNLPALALYEKFGFILVTETDESNKVLLILSGR